MSELFSISNKLHGANFLHICRLHCWQEKYTENGCRFGLENMDCVWTVYFITHYHTYWFSLVDNLLFIDYLEQESHDREIRYCNQINHINHIYIKYYTTTGSVTKQYNLVPANGRWCSAAGEVTAGLAERPGGSLPSGLWLRSPVGWQPRTGISSGTLCSSMGPLQLLAYYTLSVQDKTSATFWDLHNYLRRQKSCILNFGQFNCFVCQHLQHLSCRQHMQHIGITFNSYTCDVVFRLLYFLLWT